MTETADVLESIVKTTADYREGEIARPTPEHVERWVRQFPDAVRFPLLGELDHVLRNTYISKEAMSSFIHWVLTGDGLAGREDPKAFWKGASLLNIQQHGNSQQDMLRLFAAGLRTQFQLELEDCDGSNGKYIYLDDVLFSGSRIGNDLSGWISEEAPGSVDLMIVVFASHTLGEYQVKTRLDKAAIAANKEIRVSFLRTELFENRLKYRDKSELLWPIDLPNDPAARDYVDLPQKYPFQPRTVGGPLGPFSSEEGRQLLEHQLLVAGINIRASCGNPKDIMRPLGFSAFGLGFGSMTVTYRNCPNNAPLALWWGVRATRGQGDWYPLFRRKTYSDGGDTDALPF